MSKSKIILDLCGGTGAWSEPYADAGYLVKVITLPEYDVTDPEVQKLCIDLEPYGILAAPPCTEFSRAKQFHGKGNYTHDFAKGLEPVIACLKIIAMAKPKWWAMENPNGYLKRWMGKPVESFEPWEFGDKYQKKTLLWGNFETPHRTVIERPRSMKKFSMLHSKEIAPEYYGKYDRTTRRSITPAGFAKAFFKANP